MASKVRDPDGTYDRFKELAEAYRDDRTLENYVRLRALDNDPLRRASEAIGGADRGWLDGKRSGTVVELKNGRRLDSQDSQF